ncbi:MAG: hypothetical protein GOMPHAMPRED_002773 [Gomphillus americanus]|uniref:DUF396-domain-containing protein n=1 Tax=Gomphillus americanus TaxID=1940652 RepID=A0A8H3IJI4_9LECA|nr:MAG: hypothetical protein GOMPHAMPRED_002773 [Gomphillus americanus]
MWILPLLGYIGLLLGFGFLTLAIASGLYYLSELVEENSRIAKNVLTQIIYAVVVFQALLTIVDRLPLWLSALSIGSHVLYLQNLRFFPIVRLTDPVFIASCVLVLVNHYFWFQHFSNPPGDPYRWPITYPSFTEIASFFFLQIWLVPFALFVSLSAGENILPSMGSEYATDPTSPLVATPARSSSAFGSMGAMLSPRSASARGDGQRSPSAVRDGSLGYEESKRRRRGGAKGLAKVVVDGVRGWVGETGETMGLWKGERTRR